MPTPITPASVRFMRHVAKQPNGCWLWTSTRAGQGRRYGSFQAGTRQSDSKVYAHRFAYETWVGPIPEGMEIDHVKSRGCVGGLCVNPAHLEVVTHAENMERARLETCRAGLHDLTDPKNQRWDEQGRRRGCIACHREKALARYHRNKTKDRN